MLSQNFEASRTEQFELKDATMTKPSQSNQRQREQITELRPLSCSEGLGLVSQPNITPDQVSSILNEALVLLEDWDCSDSSPGHHQTE